MFARLYGLLVIFITYYRDDETTLSWAVATCATEAKVTCLSCC